DRPDAIAIYEPIGRAWFTHQRYRSFTYRDLDSASTAIARGLFAEGFRRGDRVALMVKPSFELFSITFGLFKAGIIPVLIDPGIGVKQMGQCIAESKPSGFIGIPMAHIARLIFGWGRPTVNRLVTVGGMRLWSGHSLSAIMRRGRRCSSDLGLTKTDDDAAILFTSGSTGAPKGVIYRHRHFLAQVDMIRDAYDIQPGEVDLPTFPLFALFDPALQMTTVIPPMNPSKPAKANPKRLIEAIERFSVTNMFGSPALLNGFGRYGVDQRVRLSTLRRVISAGAPVTRSVMERVLAMMRDGGRIHTPYGATECLPVASISSHELLGELSEKADDGAGICVGRPVSPNSVAIVEVSDDAIEQWSNDLCLPSGQVGEVVVRGPTTTQGYFGRDRANALSKIMHLDSPWMTHRMGDLGYFDEDGRLWFCGRKKHRVDGLDGRVLTVPNELIFNTHPDVFRTAVIPFDDENGRVAALVVELEEGVSISRWPRIREALESMAQQRSETQKIRHFFRHPGFPVDVRHNAKIGREALAEWARRQ
ncbi:MAG: fatty acid CoA ligase family protein, partial [Myxococcota bacterium]|nr:fatty acid CoA ligase family protein [Myxococcota bacterium]